MSVLFIDPDCYLVVVTHVRGEQPEVVACEELLSLARQVAKGYVEDPDVWRVEIVKYTGPYYWERLKPNGMCESTNRYK